MIKINNLPIKGKKPYFWANLKKPINMKKVLYVIIGIVLLYIILAFVGPKEIKVERNITIDKPAKMVTAKLTDFKFFHDMWSPWTEKDPEMVCEYGGNPGEIGHHYSWSGNKEVGKGEMSLVSMSGDTIMQALSFEGQGGAQAYYIVKDNAESTDITWGMMFKVGFFMRPPMLFMNMDKMMGADYEKGLTKLKVVMEGMKDESATANYQIEEMQWEAKNFVGTKKTHTTADKLGAFFGESYPKLGADLGKNKLQPVMAPCAIYYSWDEKTNETDCAAVMCLPAGKTMKGWESHPVPASKVLRIAYYGPYEKVGDAHMAMGKYIGEHGYAESLAIEEYVTDPSSEPDSSKWLTNIYYVLK